MAANDNTVGEQQKNIIYRKLWCTGIILPVISSGAIPIGNDNLAHTILRSGAVHIDMVHRYNDGKNEVVIGRLLKEYDRSHFVFATKLFTEVDKGTSKI